MYKSQFYLKFCFSWDVLDCTKQYIRLSVEVERNILALYYLYFTCHSTGYITLSISSSSLSITLILILIYAYWGSYYRLAVFEAKFLARLYCYLKRCLLIWLSLIFLCARKMMDILILKLCSPFLNCLRNLPLIGYTKPRI